MCFLWIFVTKYYVLGFQALLWLDWSAHYVYILPSLWYLSSYIGESMCLAAFRSCLLWPICKCIELWTIGGLTSQTRQNYEWVSEWVSALVWMFKDNRVTWLYSVLHLMCLTDHFTCPGCNAYIVKRKKRIVLIHFFIFFCQMIQAGKVSCIEFCRVFANVI